MGSGDKTKFDPPRGRMPAPQFLLPGELQVDAAYQRAIDTRESQTLIRSIAQRWNWDLCQCLVVARRPGGEFFVIDGQHRLMAAKLRGDIMQLPCVVVDHASIADEAASFVSLNSARRPLTPVALFRAAVASGDEQAVAIDRAILDAGLTITANADTATWRAGWIKCVPTIERLWKRRGASVTSDSLSVIAAAFSGEGQAYAGTILPGIAAWVGGPPRRSADERVQLAKELARIGQKALRERMLVVHAGPPEIGMLQASVQVIDTIWHNRKPLAPAPAAAAPIKPPIASPARPQQICRGEPVWCDQCERRVKPTEAEICKSPFCRARA